MNNAIIGLASNRNEGENILRQTIEKLSRNFRSARFSDCYLTDPVGSCSKRMYWNCTGIIETDLEQDTLKNLFKTMEREAGRMSDCKQTGDIPLDIDIVVWNNNVVRPRDWEQPYFQTGLKQLKQ